MFIAMIKDCTDPGGHKWDALTHRTSAGSAMVRCALCHEVGYMIDSRVIDSDEGQPGEELF